MLGPPGMAAVLFVSFYTVVYAIPVKHMWLYSTFSTGIMVGRTEWWLYNSIDHIYIYIALLSRYYVCGDDESRLLAFVISADSTFCF